MAGNLELRMANYECGVIADFGFRNLTSDISLQTSGIRLLGATGDLRLANYELGNWKLTFGLGEIHFRNADKFCRPFAKSLRLFAGHMLFNSIVSDIP